MRLLRPSDFGCSTSKGRCFVVVDLEHSVTSGRSRASCKRVQRSKLLPCCQRIASVAAHLHGAKGSSVANACNKCACCAGLQSHSCGTGSSVVASLCARPLTVPVLLSHWRRLVTMPEESTVALDKLKAENAAMEKEIMALTKGSIGGETREMSGPASVGGIKVLNYGTTSTGDEAGKDLGSSWCPPQCSRRTVLGGFFTS